MTFVAKNNGSPAAPRTGFVFTLVNWAASCCVSADPLVGRSASEAADSSVDPLFCRSAPEAADSSGVAILKVSAGAALVEDDEEREASA